MPDARSFLLVRGRPGLRSDRSPPRRRDLARRALWRGLLPDARLLDVSDARIGMHEADTILRRLGKHVMRQTREEIGEGVLVDGDGKEIARGSGTFMPSRVVLDERVGYR